MKRGWGCWRIVLLLGLLGWWTQPAEAQEHHPVTAVALTPQVDATPREAVTLRLRFENTGTGPASFVPEVTPPIGWAVLVPPGEVKLDPGRSTVALFTLLVPADAEAHTYVFPVTYRLTRNGPLEEELFAVRIPTIDRVTLALVEGPTYVTGDRFTSRFLLRNEGNTRHSWVLTARSSASLPLEIEPAHVELDSGAAIEVLVHVEVPDDSEASARHVLTLNAELPERPEVRAVARSTSTLIPRTPSPSALFHTFPLTTRLSLGLHHDRGASISAPMIELSGTGPLTNEDPDRLSVRLETSLAHPLAPEEFLIAYRNPTWRLSVGHHGFERSSLLASEHGFGVSAERSWRIMPQLDVTGMAQLYAGAEGPALTADAHATISEAGRVGATLHASRSELITTLEAGYEDPVAGSDGVELAKLRGRYALRTVAGTDVPGHAFEVEARLREGASNADLRYRLETAGFVDTGHHRAQLGFKAALRLNEALHVESAPPVNLHLEYALDDAWPGTPEAETSRSARTLGATLTGRLGQASVSIGHRQEHTRMGDESAWKATSHLQAYLPLGDRASIRNRVSWIRVDEVDTIRYEGSGTMATGEDDWLSVRLDLQAALDTPRSTTLDFTARWAGALSPALFLQAEAEIGLIGRVDVVALEVEARQHLANGHEIEVEIGTTVHEQRSPSVTVSLGYAVPLQVPIGRRTDVGTIRGHVRTPRGVPLEGVIVTTSGSMAVTTADGSFALHALPPGDHQVMLVPTTIPIDAPVITSAPPHPIEVTAGETASIVFEVEAGATVTGSLLPARSPEDGSRVALGPDSDANRWLAGAIIELSDGTARLRTTTDASGAFRLAAVPPGAWTVRVHHPSLPTDFRIEPAERTLRLQASVHERVEFRLLPVRRAIRFQEGGQLDGESE